MVRFGDLWLHGVSWQQRAREVVVSGIAVGVFVLIGVGGRLVLRVSGVDSHRCVSQANYCRMVLAPMQFYAFLSLKDGLFFFLDESKSFPGRGEKAESEAIGRHFGLTWFEKVDDLPDGVHVRRTAREGQHMDLMLQTPAELLRAAG